jgi:branched-chain amino acid transport system substrate-binding protein
MPPRDPAGIVTTLGRLGVMLRRSGSWIRSLGIAAILLGIATTAAEAQIRIAVAGPMSGSLAVLGHQMRVGVEAAVAAINGAGGLLDQQIVIEIADDGCSEERAPAVANQLVGAGVAFVVGHFCSAAAIAAAGVYADAGIVAIAPGAPDPQFTEARPGNGIFRLFGRSDEQGRVIAAHLVEGGPGATIAVVDDRTPYGRGLVEDVTDEVEALGGVVAVTETFSRADEDLGPLVDRLVAGGVSIVFVGAYADEAARLASALRARNAAITIVGGDALADPAFLAGAGTAAEGVMFAYLADYRDAAEAGDAVAAIRALGDEPDGVTLYAYAAVEAWAEAVRLVGNVTFGGVVQALTGAPVPTALGLITFSPIGEVDIPGWSIYRWEDGRYLQAPAD